MEVYGPKYIGRVVGLQALRNYILDLQLSEEDTVLLHPENFDDLVLEYRHFYQQPIADPYFLLGPLIDEADDTVRVPKDRVVVLYGDIRPNRVAIAQAAMKQADDGRELFRCSQCGRLVTAQGLPIADPLRKEYINWLIVREDASTQQVPGECCIKI